MNNGSKKTYLLNREGTFQSERFPEALNADYVKLDERSLADLVKQTAEYAKYVNYYNDANEKDGDWTDFFKEIYDYNTQTLKFNSIEELEEKSSTSPHLALFLAFLRIFKISQDNLNLLTQKHLDYYYKEILQIKPNDFQPDKVPLFFELNKVEEQVIVPAKTLFEAGPDRNGKPLYFATKNDLIVNRAKVTDVKSLSLSMSLRKNTLSITKTDDVLKTIASNIDQSTINTFMGIHSEYDAPLGFAIASPIFNLKEGRRRITIETSSTCSSTINPASLKAEYTSEKGWVEAEVSFRQSKYFLIRILTGQPPMLTYDETVHKSGYKTSNPVLRIFLNNDKTGSYKTYSILKTLKAIKITALAENVKDLLLQNDYGVLDNKQAFLPFGTRPIKDKSVLYIGNNCIFNKYLDSFSFDINWKGLPESLKKYYESYSDALKLTKNTRIKTFKITAFDNFTVAHPPGKVSILDAGTWKSLSLNKDNKYQGNTKTKAYKELHKNIYKPLTIKGGKLLSNFSNIQPECFDSSAKSGFVKIELDNDFGHSIYQTLFSEVMLAKTLDKDNKSQIPEIPYTPEFKSLTIDYSASATIDFKEHQLFNVRPFGYDELKAQKPLFVNMEQEGSVFIGIKDLSKPVVLSLYCRLDETHCNINKTMDYNNVSWRYLNNNLWVDFKSSNILQDTTHKLSQSGIISFNITADAITPHTILPDNMVWIRLSIAKDNDAFPALKDVRAQVVEAEFCNKDNDISHLDVGIPAGTIAKSTGKIQGIKEITQPYNSYGGRQKESSRSFYTRVSERLRHKDRAWTVWDYERLILAHFPEVMKVKCIPSSNANDEYAPGSVNVVIIPDIDIIPQINTLKPIMSRSLQVEIADFLSSKISPFVTITINNPKYEEIKVRCSVAFTKECSDESFYKNRLNEDLKLFLCPWINNRNDIRFCKVIYKSQIIDFIEKRPYIDYINSINVYVNNSEVQLEEMISGTKGNVILTSSINHEINV